MRNPLSVLPAPRPRLPLERNALLRPHHSWGHTPRPPGPIAHPVVLGRPRDLRVVVGLLLALLSLAGPAESAWMVPPSPYRAKDFSIVKRDGWFHCFYIRRDTSVPYDSTERDFGHAISRDLYLWTQLPAVLPVRPSHWDNSKVWAPDIREIDGVYYMFYTGVTNKPGAYAAYQRIGLATSTDLMTWNRLDEPLLSCAEVRWTFCDPLQFTGGEFRDAFVMPDGAGPGWLMYYTARPSSSPDNYVVGMASSDGDLTQWTNREPLWITHSSFSGTSVVESPHVFKHGDLYYLVFTGNGAQPLRLATGPDPTGPASSWTYRGTLSSMVGLNTAEWFASEYFVDGTHEYFSFINYDRMDTREIHWGPSWQFFLEQPDLFHVQRMTWNVPQVTEGQAVRLRIESVNGLDRDVRLEAFEVDAGGGEEPIPLAQLGLPDSIPVTGPTTDYWWVAKGWPDPEESGHAAEIVVRLTDRTAVSPPISISPDPWLPSDGSLPGDQIRRVPRAFDELSQGPAGFGFRAVQRSPLGATALLVDLAEPARVTIDIFDLAGRRVRGLADRTLPAGATVIPWDGREQGGARARPGVYFARLAAPGFERTVRVLSAP